MVDAIVGHSGFVGQNLVDAHEFGAKFNSRTIASIRGQSFDTVVCAGAPATMWIANKNPEADRRNILDLISNLERMHANRFILISTIAVLADVAAGFDEFAPQFEASKAYGRNRRYLEAACASMFARTHIVRLPAVFGRTLKKNFLFDILNPVPSYVAPQKYAEVKRALAASARPVMDRAYRYSREIDMYECDRAALEARELEALVAGLADLGFSALNFTNSASEFQFYGVSGLWSDIGKCIAHELPVVHLAPAPLRAADVHERLTGKSFRNDNAPLYREDTRTAHAALWGGPEHYIRDGDTVLAELEAFYRRARRP